MNLAPAAVALLALYCGPDASAQDPIAAFPANYRMILDNSNVTVVSVHYGPHEKIGVHDHSKVPTIYVYLSDSGPVRFSHFEEHAFALVRPPTFKGSFRVSPGRIERHAVEQLGEAGSDFLRVELKHVPLGSLHGSFRGNVPVLPLKDAHTDEYSNSVISVERLICARRCELDASAAPASLLVAFSRLDIEFRSEASERREIKSGDVLWLNPGQTPAITPAGNDPAHLLRIIVKAGRGKFAARKMDG